MKNVLVALLITLFSTVAFSNDVPSKTDKEAIEQQKKEAEKVLNKIGNEFIDLWMKGEEKQAYTLLHPALQEKVPYDNYLEINKMLKEMVGAITSYDKEGELKRVANLTRVGSELKQTSESTSVWYSIKTEKFNDDSVKLEIGFSDESKDAKITKYKFPMRIN